MAPRLDAVPGPYAGVVIGSGGVLYGTTAGGSVEVMITVFALKP